jgi:SAM-dependent methyltransferase
VDVGRLYDEHVAPGYDAERFGLLTKGRRAALDQLRHGWNGGGAPQARLVGVDLSRAMLDVTMAKLPEAELLQDDAGHVRQHLPDGSVDLVLLHFVTTYLDVPTVLDDIAAVLRPGGLLSLVSSTYEAFPAVGALAAQLLGDDLLRALNPAPADGDELERAVRGAGLEVLDRRPFTAEVRFDSVTDLWEWGMTSGFFTHVLDGLPAEARARLPQLDVVFPLRDEYRATVLLAAAPRA